MFLFEFCNESNFLSVHEIFDGSIQDVIIYQNKKTIYEGLTSSMAQGPSEGHVLFQNWYTWHVGGILMVRLFSPPL